MLLIDTQIPVGPGGPQPDPTSTPEFRVWFGGSKVVDAKGRPQVVHHGSGTNIQRFDYAYTELGHQALGSGFYFTTSRDVAHGYTTHRMDSSMEKPGGEDNPTVVSVYLNIRHPLDATKKGVIPRPKIAALIKASPELRTNLENWGDVQWEGKTVVFNRAVDGYYEHQDTVLRTLNTISTDFYQGHVREFNQAVRKVLGYDGVRGDLEGETHWVAWFPEQIKSISATRFDPQSEDINE